MSDEFKQFDATEEQRVAIQDMYEHYDKLYNLLQLYVEKGRYLSICKTKLEELAMFTSKGICREGKNTKNYPHPQKDLSKE